MPLESLTVDGSVDLTPIRGLPLIELYIFGGKNDLVALKGMHLEKLVIDSCVVTNLAPLHGLPLKYLMLRSVLAVELTDETIGKAILPATDLEALRGMPLNDLLLIALPVKDSAPLQGLPLTHLVLDSDRLTDLSFVKEMPLESIRFNQTIATNGVEVLRQITHLKLINGKPAELFLRK